MKKLFCVVLIALTMMLALSTTVVRAQEPVGLCEVSSPMTDISPGFYKAQYQIFVTYRARDEHAYVWLTNPPTDTTLLVWAERYDILGNSDYSLLFKVRFTPNGQYAYRCQVIGAYDY